MYSPDDTNVCGSRGGEFEGIAVGAEICKIVFLWGNFLFTSSDTFAVDAPFSHNTHRHRQTERQQYHANSIWVWSAKNQWRMVTHEGPEHVNLLHKIPFQPGPAPFTFLNTHCKNNLKQFCETKRSKVHRRKSYAPNLKFCSREVQHSAVCHFGGKTKTSNALKANKRVWGRTTSVN